MFGYLENQKGNQPKIYRINKKKSIDTHKEHWLIKGTSGIWRTSKYLGSEIVLETKSMLKEDLPF